ncbi:MAG: transglycosylase SLT domain-containing protein [Longimicrobiales bacterium]|nr:transglycosylase SLT domain-containing protein [Longimicrobiales bacterium]
MVVQQARAEVEIGRHWHAAELLTTASPPELMPPEVRMLLVRARAGHRDWDGVRTLLEGEEWWAPAASEEANVLLGRVYEARGAWSAAAAHYRRAASAGASDGGGRNGPVLVRLARAELGAGDPDAALRALRRVPDAGGWDLRGAAARELAEERAPLGDTATTAALVALVRDPALRSRSRGLLPQAVLAAGDSVRALDLYRSLLPASGSEPGDVRWRERVASLSLARGDTAGARTLFAGILAEGGQSPAAVTAARVLVALGGLTREETLDAARILDRAGEGGPALRAYDAHVRLSAQQGVEAAAWARVERARLAATVPGRIEQAIEEFRALDEHPDPAIGARVLDVWAGVRRRQGQLANVRTLQRWLVERYPDTDQAARVVLLEGDRAQDAGDREAALGHYARVAAMAPTRSHAGLARMRSGRIRHFRRDREGALDEFRSYLDDFPRGRRWGEASLWAGRILMERGDSAEATTLMERVLVEEPFSFHAAEAAALLGRDFPGPLAPAPDVAEPAWVAPALTHLDQLEEAGLDGAMEWHTGVITDRAEAEGRDALYPLAEGLSARGRTIPSINLGWALRRAGEAWNARLLRVLYPFPHRAMVEREAAEWGVDPILMAALIRQESAWDRAIVSSAGAIGLMQVMPATGRELARAVGPAAFTPESLESAEVNLHLGARFLRDMQERFGPGLPLVLSAYNAGPTRARRWREFPEAVDRLHFIERIPFTETRGYVQNVTRNLALYRALYGNP